MLLLLTALLIAPLPGFAQIDYQKKIQEEIFDVKCVSCHGTSSPAGNLNLTQGNSYGNLVAAGRVIRFNAASSLLVQRITSTAPTNPMLNRASQDDINLITQWINDGAFQVGRTITTSASPSNGGTTSGGGTFENGSTVTVVVQHLAEWL